MENENVESLNTQPTPQPTQPTFQSAPAPVLPEEYKPISMWGYFGYELLFSIPCVGFIVLLVFAFGGNKNINVRNFARSKFCYIIVLGAIIAIIALIIFVLGVPAILGSNTASY